MLNAGGSPYAVTFLESSVANHKDAAKRNRQNQRLRAQNRQYRTRMRGQIKKVRAAIESGDATVAGAELKTAVGILHRLASKGILHRRQAGRKISRLQQAVNQLSS
jgi:small subunit ribosomal protein S20